LKNKLLKEKFTYPVLIPALLLCLPLVSGCHAKVPAQIAALMDDVRYGDTLTISIGRYVQSDPRLPDGDTYTDNAYTRYIKERLNIDFTDDFEASGDDFERQVSLSIASGEIPDIMTVRSLDTLNELIAGDLIADLTDAYTAYASPRLRELYDSYGGRCLEKATYAGRLMALPGTRADDQPMMFWIRQDWLDRCGLVLDPDGDHCQTLDELENAARTFIDQKAGGEGTLGLAFNSGLWDEFTVMEAAFGTGPNHWLRDGSGNVYFGSVSDETRAILEQLHNWYASGILDPQFGTRKYDDITALLINGKLGIVPGQWHIPDWRLASVRKMDPKAMFRAYTLADANGKVHVTHNDAAQNFVVVRKDFSNPEAVVLLANILYDELKTADPDQYPDIAAYVGKGVDNSVKPLWIEVEPASGVLDEYAELKNLVDGKISVSAISDMSRGIIGAGILDYLDHPDTADTGEWSYYLSRIYGLGLMYDTNAAGKLDWVTPVFPATTDTMKQRGANLQTMQEEYFVKIITGVLPLSAFDTFTARWMNEGGGSISAEIEKQNAIPSK